ncbi:MAG: hypothetical protein WCG63_01500 [Opitutaceae bacterium]
MADRSESLPPEASDAVGVAPLSTVAVAAASASAHGTLFGDDAPWPTDEVGESAFLAEARERGETVAAKPAATREEIEAETGPLPALDVMVQRIPAEVRDVLEELYRAKFTAVRQVSAKFLK